MSQQRPSNPTNSAFVADNEALIQNVPIESVFPIVRCIPELFERILQAVVDDEAARIQPDCSYLPFIPRTPTTLALVCKYWKETVYGTPSLWAVIQLHLAFPIHQVKARYDRLISRAKAGPVDLYLFGIHIHCEYSVRHTTNTCPSTANHIRYFLEGVQNMRKLQLKCFTSDIQHLVIEQFPPRKAINLREFAHFYFPEEGESLGISPLTEYLGRMKNLVDLYLNEVGRLEMDICSSTPIFPMLKRLTVQSGRQFLATPVLIALLSHTPNIETL
jgi:hypothetical protein